MDNLNDLKKVWLTADTTRLPNPNEIKHVIKKYRNAKLQKKTAVIIVALLLTGIMVSVLFNYRSTMLITRIGEVCLIIAGIFLVVTNINSINRLYRYNDFSNKDFIEFLKHTRVRQIRYYKKTQVAGLACASVGLLLYIYEGVYQDRILCIISYTLLVAYILIMWLVIRPIAFRRRTKKLDETIKKLEELYKQF